jgi:3-deoxy-D-manno-octulosonic-acid transferase
MCPERTPGMNALLNLAYLLILLLAVPVLLYRRIVHGKYRDGWTEKLLGRLPVPDGNAPRVWFHAVSVGEVLQLETLVADLQRQRPDLDIVITTTTSTGLAVAKDKFPRCHVCYFPLDFSWAVRYAIARVRPDAVVLVELELWPNFIREVQRRGIPLLLVNGRISEQSFRGYRRLRFLMRPVLNCFRHLAVQSETYAQRLEQLGAPSERITVTGSIKFDGVQTDRDNPRTQELRRALGIGETERVFVAGSTHAPEEEFALDAWRQLHREFPHLRLVLVPRHKERFDEVARLVESRGLPLRRRSETNAEGGPSFDSRLSTLDSPVILLDTLGELSACWGLADVAFVGGSLTPRGGQNMIEPAAYGAAVLFGPNTRNFREVVERLLEGDAARVVRNGDELESQVRELLRNPAAAERLGRNAQRLVLAQQGATRRTLTLITHVLPSLSAHAAHRIPAA